MSNLKSPQTAVFFVEGKAYVELESIGSAIDPLCPSLTSYPMFKTLEGFHEDEGVSVLDIENEEWFDNMSFQDSSTFNDLAMNHKGLREAITEKRYNDSLSDYVFDLAGELGGCLPVSYFSHTELTDIEENFKKIYDGKKWVSNLMKTKTNPNKPF
jgi:hypothetical protein